MPTTPLPAAARPRRRLDAFDAADRAAPQAALPARGDQLWPREEAEAREAAGRRVAEAAKKLSGARDGERAGLGPS